MALRFVLLTICLYLATPSNAQDGTWKKSSKTADQLYATGNYEEAANYYLEAYQQKKSKPDFLYKAANCYEHLRFYKKAANFYKELKDHKDFPLAPLQYAKALKQNAEYQEAMVAFKSFLVNYTGEDKSYYIKIIKNEVKGCEYALSGAEGQNEWIAEHLSENINTVADEVAPLPFNDDIIYFTSTMEGFSKIYRSHFQGGTWSKAVVPSFPSFKDQHVAHGTFTPDHHRFYFTLCNNTDFDVVNGQCDLYVTVRENDAWSTPRKLRDYVKLEGTTATHPFVIHEGDMEVLYFASDRKGGKGGMDIWFMTRHVDSPEYDFTLPQNAGNNVNTYGDELTPYYDIENGYLYYSSNGHPSIGGFDVFKSLGSMSKFSSPQNLGKPVNSSADDYYFVENKSKTGAYVASNRVYGSEKITTNHDDLFYVSAPAKEIFARGNIYDKSNNSIINDVQVVLYEMKNSGKKRLLQSIIANNGAYQFSLIPERTFKIIVIKEGYANSEFNFNTIAFDENKEYGKSIYLDKEAMVAGIVEPPALEATSSTTASITPDTPVVTKAAINNTTSVPTPTPVATGTVTTDTYINAYYQGMEVTTRAPKLDGVYFKLQISTAERFNENDPMFDSVRSLGTFQTERIEEKGWTRILLSEFYTLKDAKVAMEEARINGYPESFVVKYRNGRRLN